MGRNAYEDWVKTTWRMPHELMREVKHLAIDRDTTTTQIMVKAVQEYIEQQKKLTVSVSDRYSSDKR